MRRTRVPPAARFAEDVERRNELPWDPTGPSVYQLSDSRAPWGPCLAVASETPW